MKITKKQLRRIIKEELMKENSDLATATLGAGCFWCVEAVFQELKGVESVISGYTGGSTKNPTYKDISYGNTGHAEVAQIKYDPDIITFEMLLQVFWTTHDPTTLNRQGADVGTQYRSAIYPSTPEQMQLAEQTRDSFQAELEAAGHRQITTEIRMDQVFYFAEEYHQQYLHKNPNGYCGIRGTGVSCPIV